MPPFPFSHIPLFTSDESPPFTNPTPTHTLPLNPLVYIGVVLYHPEPVCIRSKTNSPRAPVYKFKFQKKKKGSYRHTTPLAAWSHLQCLNGHDLSLTREVLPDSDERGKGIDAAIEGATGLFQGHLESDTRGTNHRALDYINHLYSGLVHYTAFGFLFRNGHSSRANE